ncbi:hypothetical protein J437_LFUL008019 [Ladona fulva]|uniref:Mitochondrial ribosomal protein S34 n=1 Tax=Ladona fulva TaxID=123851 RepID=A0A8K0KEI3_LADFU|nr:hypothetical protein J437_LFUL008019 [Ladona fulva]
MNFVITMPIKYIGRTTTFRGKSLWEIVGNLKDFGVGRMVVRSNLERYPEPSYMRVVKVEAVAKNEGIRRVQVWVEKVFRGRKYPNPIKIFLASYKKDYRLIPKDEEEVYAKGTKPAESSSYEDRILPPTLPMPPLIVELNKAILLRKGIVKEVETTLPLEIQQGQANRARVADSAEKATVKIGQVACERLYEGIK